MGVRLRRLREERQLTQQALASAIGISLSYLNQLENNQRPLTIAVLLKLNTAFGTDVQLLSDDDEARLMADLREALSDRINDAKAVAVITADGGYRRGKVIELKKNVDAALVKTPTIQKCIVVNRTNTAVTMQAGRDVWYHEEMKKVSARCTSLIFLLAIFLYFNFGGIR